MSNEDIWEVRKSFLADHEGEVSAEEACVQGAPNSNGEVRPSADSRESEKTSLKSNSKSSLNLMANQRNLPHNGSKQSILSDNTGSVISCHEINYTVQVKVGRCCGEKQQKSILKDISGIFKPGLNAIMGPTGGGKTSLLDILAGRKDPGGLTGDVLVDGAPQPANFKCMAGYVTQDDIVMGMLTVRENIQFSAALRLPSTTSQQDRDQRVNDVIDDLGLAMCADTKVGTQFVRGVSGGERKRTIIAMELITAPSVLFLDEPTTGLDANTAHSVMHVLKKAAQRGKTIIFSIHQPRYSIFKLFDNLLLLSQGEMVYQGPAIEALDYFTNSGYECEVHNNPADFFLDVVQGGIESTAVTAKDNLNQANGQSKERDTEELIINVDEEGDSDSDSVLVRQRLLVQSYTNSQWNNKLQEDLAPIKQGYEKCVEVTSRVPSVSYPTSFFTQLGVVSGRTWRNMVRNPHTLATQCFAAILLGLIIGAIYFQVDTTMKGGIQNRVGAFFFIVMNYVFGNMSAVDIFIKERALFIHENVSGFYRVSSYFFAKLFCDVAPQKAFPIVLFAALSYWMIGFRQDVMVFLFYILNIFLTSIAGTSVALMLSASVRVYSIGAIFTALIWVFMMVFSGLLINVDTAPRWLQWLKYLSIFRYSMNAFTINELKGAKFCDEVSVQGNATVLATNNTTTTLPQNAVHHCDYGSEYLSRQGIAYENPIDLWINEIALVALATIFLLITYIQLRRIKKLK